MARINIMDISKLSKLKEDVNSKADEVNKLVLDVVSDFSKELDELIYKIKDDVYTKTLTTEQLEFYAMELSANLYYLGQSQEYLGLCFDTSKVNYKNIYSVYYEEAVGTIEDKKAYSENKCLYESMVMSINERAYKRIKIKIENAYELLNSIKKVISRRIAEYELSKVSSADVKLNKYNVVGSRNDERIRRK